MSFSSVGKRFHARGAATENARSTIHSPLGSWLEEVAVAGARSEERGDRHEQIGDVVRRLTNQGLVHEETQFVLDALHDRSQCNSRKA